MLDSDDPEAMAAYIEAADRYFRELKQPQRLFAKPFVPLQHAGYNVVRLGYLLHHLDHQRPHTVLDFGAGMCWLTAILLRTGCRVVALDVSAAALALGADAIRQAHLPLEARPAEFLTYDGFRIPLDDGSVDRVACFDALHHVPNKRTVLRELYRVLRHGGRACFVEPGPGHAASVEAIQESHDWGVLEDEVDAPALCSLATEVGFSAAYVVPLPTLSDNNLDPAAFQRIRNGGRHQVLAWTGNDALIVVDKLSTGARDSRSPGRLGADIQVLACPDVVAPDSIFSIALHVTNVGDTVWLALSPTAQDGSLDYASAFLAPASEGVANTNGSVAAYRRFIEDHGLEGAVTIGAQLWPLAGTTPIDIDCGRGFLEADLHPGESARATIALRAPIAPGLYRFTFDGVAEALTWFADRGSPVEHRYVAVSGGDLIADSRAPGRLTAAIRVITRAGRGNITVAVTNTGDTVWLAHPLRDGGWVQLGVQTATPDGAVIDREWRRVRLPRDVPPGDSVTVHLDLTTAPASLTTVRLDLVSELRCWFEDRGSVAVTCAL